MAEEEQYYSYATNTRGPLSELVGKTASGNFCTHEQQVNELKAKIASLEKEKEEAYKQGTEEQIAKSNRQAIAEMIPRNLPQYRSDEDFDKEVELRVSQIGEYTTLEDMRDLYDGKLRKYARQLAGKTASDERRQFYDFIHDPLGHYGIVGNHMVYSNNRSHITHHEYDPPGSSLPANRQYRGRTASSSMNNNNPFWYLGLFEQL